MSAEAQVTLWVARSSVKLSAAAGGFPQGSCGRGTVKNMALICVGVAVIRRKPWPSSATVSRWTSPWPGRVQGKPIQGDHRTSQTTWVQCAGLQRLHDVVRVRGIQLPQRHPRGSFCVSAPGLRRFLA